MPAVAPQQRITVEDYLALDAEAPEGVRYEYWNGETVKMAGAEPEHNQVKDNIARELGNRLQPRGCWVMTSDQRVRVGEERYVYPDVVVACAPEYAETRPRTLLNPELIIEVLSDESEKRDHTRKLAAYTQRNSLHEYWIVEPRRAIVAQYVRRVDEWRLRVHDDLEQALRSPHFEIEVSLNALYALVL